MKKKISLLILLSSILFVTSCMKEREFLSYEFSEQIENQVKSIKTGKVTEYLDSLKMTSNDENLIFLADVLSIKYNKSYAVVDKLTRYRTLFKAASLENLDPYNKHKVRVEMSQLLLRDGNTYSGINQMLLGIGELEHEPEIYGKALKKSYAFLSNIETLNSEEREYYTNLVLDYADKDDIKIVATANYNLGYFSCKEENYDKAIRYLKKSIDVSQKIEGNFTNEFSGSEIDVINFNWSFVYPLLLDCFAKLNQGDAVYEYIDQAEELYDNGIINESSYTNFKLHAIPSLIGIPDYRLAADYIDYTLNTIENNCYQAYNMTIVFGAKAILHKKLNQKDEQIDALKQKLYYSNCTERSSKYFIQSAFEATEELIEIHTAESNIEQVKQYQASKIDLLEEEKKVLNKIQHTSKVWSTFELEAERRKNEYHKTVVQNEKNRFYYLLGFTFLAMTVSFYIYRLNHFLKKSQKELRSNQKVLGEMNNTLKRNNEIITSQNIDLSNQKLEIETRLKEKLLFISSFASKVEAINQSLKDNDQLTNFQIYKKTSQLIDKNLIENMNLEFQERHKEFVKELCLVHPDLTSNNIRLCILLKLNLTTKEIAQIESKTPESIKVARSRLRRKLSIEKEKMSLSSYLNSNFYTQ